MKESLSKLIEFASSNGMIDDDIKNAKDFLYYNEYGLCFETVISQMYEYNIKIDVDFYNLVCKIGEKLNLEFENYSFIKELINESSGSSR